MLEKEVAKRLGFSFAHGGRRASSSKTRTRRGWREHSSTRRTCKPVSRENDVEIDKEEGAGTWNRGGDSDVGAPSPSARVSRPNDEDAFGFGQTNASSHDKHIKVMSGSDLPKLVSFFRQASPYIGQHYGKVFVIMIPGYITIEEEGILDTLLQDVVLLHGLGVKVCLVVGAKSSVDRVLQQMGEETHFIDGYRVTTAAALQAVRQASGAIRIEIESKLSKFFPAGSTRRHGYGYGQSNSRAAAMLHNNSGTSSSFGGENKSGIASNRQNAMPPLQVVSGNFIMAKHKGVVGGVNFEFTGEVRNVWADAILQHMERNQVVILNNLGYTESGQVLNCSAFEVARKASQALKADKLIVYHGQDITKLGLPTWIGLSDDSTMRKMTMKDKNSNSSKEDAAGAYHSESDRVTKLLDSLSGEDISKHDSNVAELSLAVKACSEGVPRTHLINAYTDGALFLELYTRDGLGTMVSRDLYEGMRQAVVSDVEGLKELVRPLEKVGTLIERSEEEIRDDIRSFTVVEREGKIIGCCLLKLLGNGMGEVSAFVVQEQFRTEHRGDALLDYVEQKAKSMGMKGLVLLTTRTGDWFVARGFERRGTAHLAHLVLPPERISTIDPQRKSILFVKVLDAEMIGPPGSRIGY